MAFEMRCCRNLPDIADISQSKVMTLGKDSMQRRQSLTLRQKKRSLIGIIAVECRMPQNTDCGARVTVNSALNDFIAKWTGLKLLNHPVTVAQDRLTSKAVVTTTIEFDSNSNRPPPDSHSTAIRPRYDRSTTFITIVGTAA